MVLNKFLSFKNSQNIPADLKTLYDRMLNYRESASKNNLFFQEFWRFLMSRAKNWGMIVYEQVSHFKMVHDSF